MRDAAGTIQAGGGKEKVIFAPATLYVVHTRPGRGIGHGGARGKSIGGKEEN